MIDPMGVCPRCDGNGHVDCYCGGDQCVCTEGYRQCSTCWGEGLVFDPFNCEACGMPVADEPAWYSTLDNSALVDVDQDAAGRFYCDQCADLVRFALKMVDCGASRRAASIAEIRRRGGVLSELLDIGRGA